MSATAAMGADRDLIHEDKAVRDNGVSYIRAAVDALHAVGGTGLLESRRGLFRQRDIKQMGRLADCRRLGSV